MIHSLRNLTPKPNKKADVRAMDPGHHSWGYTLLLLGIGERNLHSKKDLVPRFESKILLVSLRANPQKELLCYLLGGIIREIG